MAGPPNEPLLLSKEQIKRTLGIGDIAFAELGVRYVQLGRRRRYLMQDVMEAIASRKREGVCRSGKERARRTGGTTSPSAVIGFEEALKQPT